MKWSAFCGVVAGAARWGEAPVPDSGCWFVGVSGPVGLSGGHVGRSPLLFF